MFPDSIMGTLFAIFALIYEELLQNFEMVFIRWIWAELDGKMREL